jgi:hypothetical protein
LAVDRSGWVVALDTIFVLVISDRGERLIFEDRDDDQTEPRETEAGYEAEDECAEVAHAWAA